MQKPKSFKEFVGQSLIARNRIIQDQQAELIELRARIKEYFCKFCKKPCMWDDSFVRCYECGYKACHDCVMISVRYSTTKDRYKDFCPECINIKCCNVACLGIDLTGYEECCGIYCWRCLLNHECRALKN